MKRIIGNRTKRRGFTLVELLIVVIIIGILSGGMMLVAGSGTDKAEATRIVSDLRTLKTAALMYAADNNMVWTETINDLSTYLDKSLASSDYGLEAGSDDLWVLYKGTPVDGVKKQLATMAEKERNLFGTPSMTDLYEKSDSKVYMKVR